METMFAATNISRNATLVGTGAEQIFFSSTFIQRGGGWGPCDTSSHLSSSLQLALATIMWKIAVVAHFVGGQRHVPAVAFEVARTAPPANRPPNTSSSVWDFDMIMFFLGGRGLLQVVCWLVSVASTAEFEWLTSFQQLVKMRKACF